MKVVFLSISATRIETCDIQTIEAMRLYLRMTNQFMDTSFFLQTILRFVTRMTRRMTDEEKQEKTNSNCCSRIQRCV